LSDLDSKSDTIHTNTHIDGPKVV